MMNHTVPAPPTAVRPPRDVRTVRRITAALVLPVPVLCIALAQSPGYGLPDTRTTLQAIAGDPGGQHVAVWLGAVSLLTLVPAFLAAARLARRRRPTLAALAAAVNTVAYLAVGLGLTATDMFLEVAARPGHDQAALARYLDEVAAHGVFGLGVGLFVFGHIVGAVLLGAALWDSIPRWTAAAMAVSQPLHFVAFVLLTNRVLDTVAWGLTGVALVACAVAVLRTPNDDWDLPPTAAFRRQALRGIG